MSTRVRFSEQRPNVAYLPASATSQVSFHILSKPLPSIRPENAYQMDLHTAASIGDMISLQVCTSQPLRHRTIATFRK